MAKDLVRTKRYVKKFIVMKANIQAVSLKITTLKSQDAMMNAMKGVTKVKNVFVCKDTLMYAWTLMENLFNKITGNVMLKGS